MAPSKPEYEFGGPIGAALTTLSLPFVILMLIYWSDAGKIELTNLLPALCPSCQEPRVLLSCTAAILGWFLFQVLLERMLPCDLVEGTPIPQAKGKRLVYRINGHLAFWVTLLSALHLWPIYDNDGRLQLTEIPLLWIYHHFAELALVTIALCFALSLYLYLNSFRPGRVLAVGGDTGAPVYDFFIGRELNPRIGSTFDWKEFCELRPGLIGWMLLNLACVKAQAMELGYVSGSMMLVTLFQGIYVWDALYQERAILTTMDITTDGFGYMLVLGDLAWVPFTYSLQARYLVKHDPQLSNLALAGILLLHILGYCVFRGANGQKDAFRRDPNDPKLKHLTYLQTKRGTKLLTSGWWGMARKINYTGDYIMGLTWCLVCGMDSIVPYYYAIYFAILLIHRSIRDDHMCHQKYGDDWLEYKKLVPYRFIPGII